MSDIAKQIASIEPLTGQANYRLWSLKVKSLAFVGTCWDAILGTDTAATSEEADKRAHYAREQKASGLIQSTVSSTLMIELSELPQVVVTAATGDTPAITREPNAHEYWAFLKDRFEKKDRISAVLDYCQYVNTHFVDDGNLEAQINKYTELRTTCTLNGYKFSEFIHATHLLMALPDTPSYQQIVNYFFTSVKHDEFKLDDVRARALELENRERVVAQNAAAANVIAAKPNKKKGKAKAKTKKADCQDYGFHARFFSFILSNSLHFR